MLCLDDLDCDLLTYFLIFEATVWTIKLLLSNLKNLIYRLQISNTYAAYCLRIEWYSVCIHAV